MRNRIDARGCAKGLDAGCGSISLPTVRTVLFYSNPYFLDGEESANEFWPPESSFPPIPFGGSLPSSSSLLLPNTETHTEIHCSHVMPLLSFPLFCVHIFPADRQWVPLTGSSPLLSIFSRTQKSHRHAISSTHTHQMHAHHLLLSFNCFAI